MKSADLWDNVVNGRENVVDAIPKIKLERNEMILFGVFFTIGKLQAKNRQSMLSFFSMLLIYQGSPCLRYFTVREQHSVLICATHRHLILKALLFIINNFLYY